MGKKVKGRKRHVIVDTEGLLLSVTVHSAGIQDRDAAPYVVQRAQPKMSRVQVMWADQGYNSKKYRKWVDEHYTSQGMWRLEIKARAWRTAKLAGLTTGFVVLQRRWVVERTFAWLGRYRRLSKDYEFFPHSSEAFIYLASSHLLLRRICSLGPQ
jgi:putative transposase